MYENAYRILDFLPLRNNSPEESRYIDYLWESFKSLGGSENIDTKACGTIPFHMLFMLCCQYKLLRITKNQLVEYQKLFILKDIKKEGKDILNPSSVFTFSKLSEKDIFRIFTLVNLPEDLMKKAFSLVNGRNDLAHANGKIEIDYELKIDLYIEILESIQNNFLDTNNILANIWLAHLDSTDDRDEFIEANLAQEYLCRVDFEDSLLKTEFKFFL